MTTNPIPGAQSASTDALAATIASVVERQLTQYLSTIHKQVEGVRDSTATTISTLHDEVERRISALLHRIESQQQASENYQRSLQKALEELVNQTEILRGRDGEVEFRIAGEFIFVNGTRLRLDLGAVGRHDERAGQRGRVAKAAGSA